MSRVLVPNSAEFMLAFLAAPWAEGQFATRLLHQTVDGAGTNVAKGRRPMQRGLCAVPNAAYVALGQARCYPAT